jgi:predicted DNA-binding WGR domain protein
MNPVRTWTICHPKARSSCSRIRVRERTAVVDRLLAAIENRTERQPAEAEDGENDDCWDEPDGPVAEAEQPPPEAMPATPSSAGTSAWMGKRYLEFVGGASRKFWEIDRVGPTLTVRFGRIGTSGQTQQKICADEASAIVTAQRLVREKLGKGYVERNTQDGSL